MIIVSQVSRCGIDVSKALDLHKERQKHVGLGASDDYQFVAGRTEYFASPDTFYDSISEALKMYPFKVIFIDVMEYCLKPEKVKAQ